LNASIEAKLAELRDQRLNDPDSVAVRDSEIRQYEALKKRVDELQEAVIEFTQQKIKEPAVSKKASAFRTGIESWWERDHKTILSTGYNVGVFLSALSICALLGVAPTFAAGLTGVLIGGKPVVDAVKALARKLS
jgi:hypothetical protein